MATESYTLLDHTFILASHEFLMTSGVGSLVVCRRDEARSAAAAAGGGGQQEYRGFTTTRVKCREEERNDTLLAT